MKPWVIFVHQTKSGSHVIVKHNSVEEAKEWVKKVYSKKQIDDIHDRLDGVTVRDWNQNHMLETLKLVMQEQKNEHG